MAHVLNDFINPLDNQGPLLMLRYGIAIFLNGAYFSSTSFNLSIQFSQDSFTFRSIILAVPISMLYIIIHELHSIIVDVSF